jgi:hypothetical protein
MQFQVGANFVWQRRERYDIGNREAPPRFKDAKGFAEDALLFRGQVDDAIGD